MIFRSSKKNKGEIRRTSLVNKKSNQRVFSYYTASRSKINQYDRQSSVRQGMSIADGSNNTKHKIFTIFVVSIIIITCAYSLSLSLKPQISIRGSELRSITEYQELAAKIIDQDYRNRVKFLFQKEKINKELYKTFPEAMSVSAGVTLLGRRPVIKITTAQPMALFFQESEESFLLSDRGKLLMPIEKSIFNWKSLPIIKNQTGVQGQQGMQFISPDEAKNVNDLILQLKQDNSQYTLTLNRQPQEINLYETGKAYYVKFLTSGDMLGQYGAMRATQSKLQKMNVTPSEYIDVRLADKVYYK
ncbi:MAG TPA: hypothetical protein PLF57_01670 [Candidatus Saccharibacteria bacterium]|nr:hypothetical protein [Candidatus Saccharibacteria bacterium]